MTRGHNLLDDPVFSIGTAEGEKTISLPGVLARLSSDAHGIQQFERLAPHQQHPWHAFLVQLAAIALHHAGIDPDFPSLTENRWRKMLLDLTGGSAEPWMLVNPQLDKPAFMQPPAIQGSPAYKNRVAHPDNLGILVTARGHGVKAARVGEPALDHWVFALVEAQTVTGYSGPTWFGSVRMNGGLGTRVCVTHTPSLELGAWWRRDVAALLATRNDIAIQAGYPQQGGIALLWLQPWDGEAQEVLHHLDPLFIEVARRLRMADEGDRLVMLTVGSSDRRVDDAGRKGVVGDPWAPIASNGSKVFTPSARGFHYRIVRDLLLGSEWRMGHVGQLQPTETKECWFVARAIVRGQGKTEGYHERFLQLPGRVVSLFQRSADRNRLAERSRRWIEMASSVSKDVLGSGLYRFIEAASLDSAQGGEFRLRHLELFDAIIDQAFFRDLFAMAEEQDGVADATWARTLAEAADGVFQMALDRPFTSSARSERARALGELTYRGRRSRFLSDYGS
jgi:CRISPR system Cascade subunit CasA